MATASAASLKIAFPPDGARVDLGLAGSGLAGPQPQASPLVLKAQGGVTPLTWLVNGVPLSRPEVRRQAVWLPDGSGFARVSVVDAKGATDTVVIRVE